jgi:hypothetical protein
MGQKFLFAHEGHSNTYKMVQRSRQYPQNQSHYKWMKTALRIASILVAP